LDALTKKEVASEIGTIESGEIPPKLLQRIATHELEFEIEKLNF
jgi:hypothetical protein